LYRVPSSNGTPVAVTKPEPSQGQASHRWPVFLPDGRHFLYLGCNFLGRLDKNMIFVGSLDSEEKKVVVNASTNFVYTDPGYLVYWRDNALVAQHFDLRSYSLAGEPRIVSDAVQYFSQTNFAVFAVASKTLVEQNSGGRSVSKSQLIWFNRRGQQVGTVGPPDLVANPKLSPDGRRVAVDQTDTDGRHVNVCSRLAQLARARHPSAAVSTAPLTSNAKWQSRLALSFSETQDRSSPVFQYSKYPPFACEVFNHSNASSQPFKDFSQLRSRE
jgi:hypothetical protein